MNLPDKKFKIILADPPRPYSKYRNALEKNNSKVRTTPYDAMSLQEIMDIPIGTITEKDSVLFLWVTFPCLEMGLQVIKAWGFTFKTVGFNWIKKNKNGIGYFMGFGHYTRSNGEICLLATKGKPPAVLKKNISQIIVTPITKHSAKPDSVRKRIVDLFGDLPRIELFARSNVSGWVAWGDDEKLHDKPLEAFA